MTPAQKLTAEALGTFVVVLVGAGTAAVTEDLVATALAFGFAVLAMMYAVGHVSGGHLNPAVSIGVATAGRMPWAQAGLYAAAQLAGALVAGLVLFVLLQGFPGFDAGDDLGQNRFGDASPNDYAVGAALLLEVVGTAVLVLVWLASTDRRNPAAAAAPVAVGLALAGLHLATFPMTGTSVNPARSLGVGVFAGAEAFLQLWLFLLAPSLGGLLAGLLHPLALGRDRDAVPGSGLHLDHDRLRAAVAAAAGRGGTTPGQAVADAMARPRRPDGPPHDAPEEVPPTTPLPHVVPGEPAPPESWPRQQPSQPWAPPQPEQAQPEQARPEQAQPEQAQPEHPDQHPDAPPHPR